MPMFMVLSSWQNHCESSPGSFDEYRTVPSGRRPKTKPDDLGCKSALQAARVYTHHRHLLLWCIVVRNGGINYTCHGFLV